MLTCIIADLVNQIRIENKYGNCTKKLQEKLNLATTYNWLITNATECLNDCQLLTINEFIDFWPTTYTICEDQFNPCVDTPLPVNDDCSTATLISYITTSQPTVTLLNQRNDRVCGTLDYPTDSGLTYPDSWDLDSNGDLWYKFNTGSSIITQPYIYILGGTIKFPQIAIYSGDCDGLTVVTDALQEETYVVVRPTVSANSNYYIRVSNSNGTINSGTFRIVISLLPIL